MSNMKVQFHNIINSSYKDVWDFQSLLHNDIKAQKRFQQVNNKVNNNLLNHLIFCEHRPVITLGKSASYDNLLLNEEQLSERSTEIFKINRGGDITFHGPGQCTGYLIFNLEEIYRDVHRFVRDIEEAIIRVLGDYGLKGFRIKDYTGVWLGDESNLRKICAIGVHLSRWVSMHGFALNIHTDLEYFNAIIPCGIEDLNKSVTSLSVELGREIDKKEVYEKLKTILADTFNFEFLN